MVTLIWVVSGFLLITMSKVCAFWFIREGDKLIQCSKEQFDNAIREGKSIKYRLYANRRSEKIAEKLEQTRMTFLTQSDLPSKFRSALTDPVLVINAEIINPIDPDFWLKESKKLKYQN